MKKVVLILFLSLVACRKVETIPTSPPTNVKIFDVRESSVENGQEIQFELTQNGVYTMTIGDSVTNQVLTRERFTGQIGINKKKIYTKSFSIKYLYLLLQDESKKQIAKTNIIVK
jgi:hypothetical protein